MPKPTADLAYQFPINPVDIDRPPSERRWGVKWPEENKAAPFTDIVGPLRHAFLQGAKWSRINADKDIEWTGLPLGPQTNVCSLEPEDHLRAENLKYSLEDQGRDFLDEFIGLALQLGMEQGRRVQLNNTGASLRRIQLKLAVDSLQGLLDSESTP